MATLVNETTTSQIMAIREQLLTEGWIDKPKALEICDCDRLASRIHDIRTDPVDPLVIRTEYHHKVNRFGHTVRFAKYVLVTEEDEISA